MTLQRLTTSLRDDADEEADEDEDDDGAVPVLRCTGAVLLNSWPRLTQQTADRNTGGEE